MVKICFQTKGRGVDPVSVANPITKEVEPKQGYVERVPCQDLCLGTGIYR